MVLLARKCTNKYYQYWLSCEEPSCLNRHTRQFSIPKRNDRLKCAIPGCHGFMLVEYTENQLHTQFKYFVHIAKGLDDIEKKAYELMSKNARNFVALGNIFVTKIQ